MNHTSLTSKNIIINQLKEDQWQDVLIEDNVKTLSHEHVLKSRGLKNTGWDCDHLAGIKKCYSGLTGFNKSSEV